MSSELSLTHLAQMIQEARVTSGESVDYQLLNTIQRYFESEVIPYITDSEKKDQLLNLLDSVVLGRLPFDYFRKILEDTLSIEAPNSARIKNQHRDSSLKQSEKILEHIRKYNAAFTQPADEIGSDDLSQRFHKENLFTSSTCIQVLTHIVPIMKSPESHSSAMVIYPTRSGIEVNKCLDLLLYQLDKMSHVWAGFCTVSLVAEDEKIKVVVRPEGKQVSTLFTLFEQKISEISFDQNSGQDFLAFLAQRVNEASKIFLDEDLTITPLRVDDDKLAHQYTVHHVTKSLLNLYNQLKDKKFADIVANNTIGPDFYIKNILHRYLLKPYPRRIRTALEDALRAANHELK